MATALLDQKIDFELVEKAQSLFPPDQFVCVDAVPVSVSYTHLTLPTN